MADADVSADALKARIIRAKLGTPSAPAGPPPSAAERFGMGAADPFYGGAQIGARMPLEGEGTPAIAFGAPPGEQERLRQSVDKTVQQREQDYQARRAAAGQTGIDFMRGAGDVASTALLTAPLAPLSGGATSFLTGVARGLGMGAAGGAIGGATEPVTGGDFAAEKTKQVAKGAAAGAVAGGALGGLGGAIATNDAEAAARLIRSKYYSGVRPGSTMTAPQRGVYDSQVRDAVDAIVNTRAGKALPKSPEEFSQAIAATKQSIYGQYSGMAQQAEQAGARVQLQPAIDRLTKLANDPLQDPAATAEAKRLLEMAKGATAITPTRAEEIVGFLNERATGFDTAGTKGAGSVFREAAGALRGSLIDAVEGAGFKDYRTLRRTYGALVSIEDDVGRATGRELAKGGPGFGLSDIGAAGLVGAGEPVSAATVEGGKFLSRWLRSPNRAITKLFEEAQSQRMPDGIRDIRDRIGQMIQRGTPAAGAVGGAAAQGLPP